MFFEDMDVVTIFLFLPLQIAIHRTTSHMGGMNILIGLCQVAAQDLQVGMPHQFLEGKDIHAIAQHDQGKGTAEVMWGGDGLQTDQFRAPAQETAQCGVGHPLPLSGNP